MMKRMRGIIAMFLLLALLLTACGQSSQTPPKAEEPEDTAPVAVQPEQEEPAQPLVFSDQPANVFRAKFEGSNVAGKGEAVDGVYRFTATKTDGEAWHVKLESNYMTVPGRDYRVTYHFNSDVAGTVKFGDFHEFAIRKGENSVTGQVSASDGYTYLDLQLGALKPFTIDFTSIEVEELETEADYESVMTVPIAWSSEGAVYVQHDPGYFYKLDRHLDGVTMKVEEIPFSAEVWMSRLYVKTAAILAPGALYRVSADVSATHEMDMEVCFNNGDNEKGYGAFYGQRMGDMSKRTFQQLIDLRSPGSEGGEVVLQFAFGKSPDGSQVTVDNIRVEKVHEHYTNMLPVGFAMNSQVDGGVETGNLIDTGRTALSYTFNEATTVYGETGDDFAMAVSRIANGAVGRITKKDNDDLWNARLYVRTGVTPEAGKAYRVTAKVHSDQAFGKYELLLNNGSGDKTYEGFWDQSIADKETKTYTKDFVAPADGCQELVLRLQMGASPVDNKVTLSDVHVYKLTEGDNLAANLSYPNTTTGVDFALETNDGGTEAKLVRSGNSATVTVNQTPGNEDWQLKFYAKPGISLDAGKTYIVEMDVAGTTNYNICFKSLKEGVNDPENAFGLKWVGEEGHVSWWITPTAEKAGGMEILLKLGKLEVNSQVTVSNVKVFVLEDVTGTVDYGKDGDLTVDNNSATVTAQYPNDDWKNKFYIKPHVTLEAGETYYADMDIVGATGYDACYKSLKDGLGDAAETAFGSKEVHEEGHVNHKITPTEANAGEMEILLKLGKLSVGSTVTVNNVKVYKKTELTATHADTTGGGNFFAEVMKGPTVGLTGNGSSATTKVVNKWEDWRIKSYAISGVTLAAGKTYKVSMKLATALGGTNYKLFFKSEGKAENAFGSWEIVPDATQTVGRIVTPNADNEGKLEIMMQLGNLPNGSAVTISDIQICEVTQGDELTHINYGSQGVDVAANNGYETSLEKAADKVQFAITKAPESAAARHTWDVKLNVRTSLIPQRDQLYRVSFDIQAEEDQGKFEVFYDGAAEKAYGEKYELKLRAGKPMTVTQFIDGGADDGALNVQIRLGETDAKTGNSYTVSNLQVKEVRNVPVVFPITKEATELWTHEDYAGTLITTATSASARLTKTPNQGKEAWKTKLFVETGAKLQAGQKYRITFTVVGSNGMPYEICLNNGGEEKGLGGIFGLSAVAEGDTITYVTTPDKDIDLVLQFSLGNAWNGGSFTVRNVKVEKAGASSTVSNVTYTF